MFHSYCIVEYVFSLFCFSVHIPEFKWAEDGEKIYLTIEVGDLSKDSAAINLTEDQFTFKAKKQDTNYEVDFKLKGKIDPQVRKTQHQQQILFIKKKEFIRSFTTN